MRSPVSAQSTEMTPAWTRPELLAPAGNWACAKAAVENGADAIYFGLDRFNARMRADNFTEADLPALMAFLHQRGVKGYVTFNTLVFTAELAAAEQYLRTLIAAGVDAAIVQDVGLCRLIRQISPDFPIHASTQMTITSAAGVAFAHGLGCQLVVLARECSLKEIHKIQTQLAQTPMALPLEVFVHGALCVAYSGQCLTSEALGGRSANRGECAQACRMTYDLFADGQPVALGDRRYLLSPQDLSGLAVLPDLVKAGVTSLKIEGRLKTPEYVANATQVYRQALDRVMAELEKSGVAPNAPDAPAAIAYQPTPEERYRLEMMFSRGLYSGWFRGIDNQALVHARFGKKRGVYLGRVEAVMGDRVLIRLEAPLKPGDGVVFDQGNPGDREEGGRVYQVELHGGLSQLRFGRHDVNLNRVQVGDRLWKTSDPELEKHLRQSFAGDLPHFQRPIDVELYGEVGQPLVAIARDDLGHIAQATAKMPLVAAQTTPLTRDRFIQQFARLGNTPFSLRQLESHVQDDVMLPVSELNRLRRSLVTQLEQQRSQPPRWHMTPLTRGRAVEALQPQADATAPPTAPQLIALVRNFSQLVAAVEAGVDTLYCELENPARYKEMVRWFRHHQQPQQTLWLVPPRITKPAETYILAQVRRGEADGYLVRNYDHLAYFAGDRCIGDFSLNVANPLTADYFKTHYHLERLTASYDLNSDQLQALLSSTPLGWLEITLHQHMPLFHMEHCVFCAFLSTGKDFRDCGRPCESQSVTLRDRVGTHHILQADAGCRNTLFNGVPQTGAEYAQRLIRAGARYFRIEFLQESPQQVTHILDRYRQLLAGRISGTQLWQELKLQSKLGVTRGPLDSAQG
ncbi:MAG: U32 family peptidase [Leptolyngbyaceae cyanobacterium T60_A2020_046]|nr:U32 family peptidase [Leptolyngbyaceae cyanobacterium T60_A2020_046]